LACVRLDPEIENRIKQVTGKSQVIEFTLKELDAIENELFLVSDYVRHPQKQRIEDPQFHRLIELHLLADASNSISNLTVQFE
jgi:hypothetical protein